MLASKTIAHKKHKLKQCVGVRQLYRRISKAVTAILDDAEIKEKNCNASNVTTSNDSYNECSNNINRFLPHETNSTCTENFTSCSMDICCSVTRE